MKCDECKAVQEALSGLIRMRSMLSELIKIKDDPDLKEIKKIADYTFGDILLHLTQPTNCLHPSRLKKQKTNPAK